MLERILCVIGELAPVATALTSLATVAVSIAVFLVTRSFNRWQKRLAREQLRHQLYDRRMRVYETFRELLFSLADGTNKEIKLAYQTAGKALIEVPLLFNEDNHFKGYLEHLYHRIHEEVIRNIGYTEAHEPVKNTLADSVRKIYFQKSETLCEAKYLIPEEHLKKLPEQFKPFLTLTDFSEPKSRIRFCKPGAAPHS